ncbi:hypothetical protein LXL04_030425 [Taraxacum kok-saghyz]
MCKTHLVLALLPSTSPATSQRRLPLHLRHPLQRPLPLFGDVLSSAGDRSQGFLLLHFRSSSPDFLIIKMQRMLKTSNKTLQMPLIYSPDSQKPEFVVDVR